MDIILSIVVPVYKIEETYFRECLNSLVALKNDDLEIILVDDGSPDKCGSICDEYAKNDDRIRVLHKKNSGVSAARNDGIRMAKGVYVMFVDADDWVDIHQIYSFLKTKYAKKYDVLFWGTKYVLFDGTDDERLLFSTDKVFETSSENEKLQLMTLGREYGTLKRGCQTECMASINNKVFRTDLICQHNIFFDEKLSFGEDGLFALKIFGVSKNCYYCHATPYHYRQRETSACHSYKFNADKEVFQVFSSTKKYLDEINAPEKFYKALNYRCFDWFSYWLIPSHIKSKDDLIKVKKKLFEEPFCSVIRTVKLKNYDWKGKIKVLLFKARLPELFILMKWLLDKVQHHKTH